MPLLPLFHSVNIRFCAIQVDGNLARGYSETYFWPEGAVMDMAGTISRVARNQEWKDEIVRLPTALVYCRLALDQEKECHLL